MIIEIIHVKLRLGSTNSTSIYIHIVFIHSVCKDNKDIFDECKTMLKQLLQAHEDRLLLTHCKTEKRLQHQRMSILAAIEKRKTNT